jgi:hypothetical protein
MDVGKTCDILGNLSRFSSEDGLRESFEAEYQKGHKWRELWEFLHIHEGDLILANNGMTSIVGVGTVTKNPISLTPGFQTTRTAWG